MSYSTFLRWKSSYLRYGLAGLLKAYNPPKHKKFLPKELLEEFEEIYLTPKRYSIRVVWEILKINILINKFQASNRSTDCLIRGIRKNLSIKKKREF